VQTDFISLMTSTLGAPGQSVHNAHMCIVYTGASVLQNSSWK